MPSFRERSRDNYQADNSMDHINAGSLQRIADATELIAKDYVRLRDERDRYERYYKEHTKTIGKLQRSISAHKAHNTRLRNRLSQISNSRSQIEEAADA
jgi:hypothetical protein